jgi:transcription-repair coupling factor (superfamily II helicase)
VSAENLKALSRLGALIGEGYPFAALQAKIKSSRADLIAPTAAHPAVLSVINDFRAAANLPTIQCVVVATGREAEDTAAALHSLVPDAEILEFPSWETLPHERLSPSPETVGKRLKVLHRLNELSADIKNLQHPVIVLASVRAVLQPVVAGLASHPPIQLVRGKEYSLFELPLKLIEIAYHRVDMVTRRGEFAVRGGILDIFPTTAEHAVRLEFFGDELDDIRQFSVADQRSIEGNVDEVQIYPAREIIITPAVASRAREMVHEFPNISTMLEKISQGIPVDGM